MQEATVAITKTPVGDFYMVIANNTVIQTGFGKPPNQFKKTNHAYTKYIEQYFSGDKTSLKNIKSHQEASDFMQKVWLEMSKIPYGQTSSYADIAKNINNPKAVRAVGTACGKNNLPLIIPCHRVIKSDGKTGNYAFGPKIKKYLLDLESKHN